MERTKTLIRLMFILGCMQLLVMGVCAADMVFRYNANRTGDYSSVAGITGTTKSLLWNYTAGASFVYSSPAVVNGIVYTGSQDTYLYANDATTGALKWRNKTGGVVQSSPAVANGVVYVGSFDKKLYAFDAATGVQKWNFTTRSGISSSPAVVNNVVYVGSSDHDVYALNAATGTMIWNYTTLGSVESSPAVVNSVVYVGSTDSNVYALNANTGVKIWKNVTANLIGLSSPAVVNGVVYIGSGDNYVYAFDAATGIIKWKYRASASVSYSSPAVVNNVVYIGCQDNKLHAINATTGKGIWNYTAGGYVKTSPAYANGIVYFGSSNHIMTALNATTGAFVWNYTALNQIDSSPAVVNGVVYFGAYSNQLYALKVGYARTSRIGVFRNSTHLFYLDINGNGAWNNVPTDRIYNFGATGDLPVSGDWDGKGITEIGVFRPSTHIFYLDYSGNGTWDDLPKDRSYNFGGKTDLPVIGDWNNNGISEIGVYRPSTHIFYLDYNGNGVWDGAPPDRSYNYGGSTDLPIGGDWNNNGFSEIGVFRPSTHIFYLDYNGNGVWDGAPPDRSYNLSYKGDFPVSGDWDGKGIGKIGVFHNTTYTFYLDYNGNGKWDGSTTDKSYTFGYFGDKPVAGKWS